MVCLRTLLHSFQRHLDFHHISDLPSVWFRMAPQNRNLLFLGKSDHLSGCGWRPVSSSLPLTLVQMWQIISFLGSSLWCVASCDSLSITVMQFFVFLIKYNPCWLKNTWKLQIKKKKQVKTLHFPSAVHLLFWCTLPVFRLRACWRQRPCPCPSHVVEFPLLSREPDICETLCRSRRMERWLDGWLEDPSS